MFLTGVVLTPVSMEVVSINRQWRAVEPWLEEGGEVLETRPNRLPSWLQFLFEEKQDNHIVGLRVRFEIRPVCDCVSPGLTELEHLVVAERFRGTTDKTRINEFLRSIPRIQSLKRLELYLTTRVDVAGAIQSLSQTDNIEAINVTMASPRSWENSSRSWKWGQCLEESVQFKISTRTYLVRTSEFVRARSVIEQNFEIPSNGNNEPHCVHLLHPSQTDLAECIEMLRSPAITSVREKCGCKFEVVIASPFDSLEDRLLLELGELSNLTLVPRNHEFDTSGLDLGFTHPRGGVLHASSLRLDREDLAAFVERFCKRVNRLEFIAYHSNRADAQTGKLEFYFDEATDSSISICGDWSAVSISVWSKMPQMEFCKSATIHHVAETRRRDNPVQVQPFESKQLLGILQLTPSLETMELIYARPINEQDEQMLMCCSSLRSLSLERRAMKGGRLGDSRGGRREVQPDFAIGFVERLVSALPMETFTFMTRKVTREHLAFFDESPEWTGLFQLGSSRWRRAEKLFYGER
ncbi:MAG: hypothetical protein AAF456_22405 [Planctomycetota bacterium]